MEKHLGNRRRITEPDETTNVVIFVLANIIGVMVITGEVAALQNIKEIFLEVTIGLFVLRL